MTNQELIEFILKNNIYIQVAFYQFDTQRWSLDELAVFKDEKGNEIESDDRFKYFKKVFVNGYQDKGCFEYKARNYLEETQGRRDRQPDALNGLVSEFMDNATRSVDKFGTGTWK